jgi:hypothetical protein
MNESPHGVIEEFVVDYRIQGLVNGVNIDFLNWSVRSRLDQAVIASVSPRQGIQLLHNNERC